MTIIDTLQQAVSQAIQALYNEPVDPAKVQVSATLPEFTGDYTVVIFPFVKLAKKAPDVVGAEIGQYLQTQVADISQFNVIKGFLNLELSAAYWHRFIAGAGPDFGRQPRNGQKVMVEYSSPNTNKPLHLGHIRNCLLGWSTSQILDAVGYDVVRVQIINDRGVAICKSMLAWQLFGNGDTPASTGIKGDHFVGDYYVMFEQKSKEEYTGWQQSAAGQAVFQQRKKTEQDESEFFKGFKNQWFNEYSQLGAQVRDMLLHWEAGDADTVALWRQMNGWVYDGFNATYDRLGVAFDKLYYESDTYLLGKDIVETGLDKGVFYRKEDGSVWIDLTDAGYDQKVILRSDGTSMYITQDLGTARMRYHDFGCDRMVYVVADEQNYHFQVLFETLKRLGEPYAGGMHHLSYGMVELPTGRMKTREGTVVDADDLMDEVVRMARAESSERGEIASLPPAEQEIILHRVGLAALKFFMLRVNARKRMIFNPEESVDLHGQTGPFIQYAWVRVNRVLEKAAQDGIASGDYTAYHDLHESEKELLKTLHEFPATILQSANEFDPSHLASYCYNLAKVYNRFYDRVKILTAETPEARAFRLECCRVTGQALQSGMNMLGMEMPERM